MAERPIGITSWSPLLLESIPSAAAWPLFYEATLPLGQVRLWCPSWPKVGAAGKHRRLRASNGRVALGIVGARADDDAEAVAKRPAK